MHPKSTILAGADFPSIVLAGCAACPSTWPHTMGLTTLSCSKWVLHLLNLVDFVLGFCIILFALLLALRWGAWSLFWLWIPIATMGGLSIMTVFTSECGVYASQNCSCMVNVSNFFALFVGAAEAVGFVVIMAASGWLKRRIEMLQDKTALCSFTCPNNGECGRPSWGPADDPKWDQCQPEGPDGTTWGGCTVEPGSETGTCTPMQICYRKCDRSIPETLICCPDEVFSSWLDLSKWALLGLALGQIVRFLSSRVFRRANRDQADIGDFTDPFLGTSSGGESSATWGGPDRWTKTAAEYQERGLSRPSARDRWGA